MTETDRLVVRRFTENDAEALYEILSDPAVMQYIEPPYTMAQTREFIRDAGLSDPPLVYAVIWKNTGRLIGHLIWHTYDPTAMELGWVIHRNFWRMGVARELTAALLASTTQDIVIECDRRQSATRHIAKSFGFQLHGCIDGRCIYQKHKNPIPRE
ncbi:MAG: GNAT family N-acetyltransferase [Clostridia bacterium]|nr:GNAT family N-acetyltransferase [Clostridia bacterium]